MKLADARRISFSEPRKEYRVSFEKRIGPMLHGDHFPERDETPFSTLTEAMSAAERFAANAPPEYVNICIVDALTWVPVGQYDTRQIWRPLVPR